MSFRDDDFLASTSSSAEQSTYRTIVASDNEVSNGFVKDGKRLPYVFEANESGKTLNAHVVPSDNIDLTPALLL